MQTWQSGSCDHKKKKKASSWSNNDLEEMQSISRTHFFGSILFYFAEKFKYFYDENSACYRQKLLKIRKKTKKSHVTRTWGGDAPETPQPFWQYYYMLSRHKNQHFFKIVKTMIAKKTTPAVKQGVG